MTEEYKLPVFFKYNEEKLKKAGTDQIGANRVLKLAFICEDSNPRCLEHLTALSEAIFRDL